MSHRHLDSCCHRIEPLQSDSSSRRNEKCTETSFRSKAITQEYAPNFPLWSLHENEETHFVMGYMVGNCVGCHNGENLSDNSSFSLEPGVFLQNTLNKETEDSASAAGVRIPPGDPENSVLYQALISDDDAADEKPMPPLGVQVPDSAAIERIREWIQKHVPVS